MIKYFVGIIGALGGALAGAWLLAAPFILAYQPEGADWADPTLTDFWTGLPLLIVSVIGLVFYSLGIFGELRERGVIEGRATARPQQSAPATQQTSAQETNGGLDSSNPSVEQALAPLLAEMLRDMQDQRRSNGGSSGEVDQSDVEPPTAQPSQTSQTTQYPRHENQRQVQQ